MQADAQNHFLSFSSNSVGLKNSVRSKDRLSVTSLSSPLVKLIMVHQMCSLPDTNNNKDSSDNYELSNRRHLSVNPSSALQQSSHHQQHNFYHRPFCFTSKHQAVLLIFYFSALYVCSSIPGTAGIDCFKCVSLNGDNPSCEDPFHNNYSVSILESPCMGGRKGRNGLFPATACIKLAGKYYETGETITVRGCALDSGTLNVDTEIIRMSHCGHFWFDDRYVKGCLQSCDDADGCNGSSRPSHFTITASIITTTLVLVLIGSISGTGLPAYFFLPNSVHRRRFHFGGEGSSGGGEIEVL